MQLKDILQKAFNGACFGLGCGAVMAAIYFYINHRMLDAVREQWDATGKVIVKTSEEVEAGERTIILGTLVNTSEHDVSSVSVVVDFFDGNGRFVDQCSEFVKGVIHPKEEVNFKTTCAKNQGPVAKHTTHKIRIAGI